MGNNSVWSGQGSLMFALPSPARISQALSHVAEAGLGTAMLYELIEVRDVLAWGNFLPFQLQQCLSTEVLSLES